MWLAEPFQRSNYARYSIAFLQLVDIFCQRGLWGPFRDLALPCCTRVRVSMRAMSSISLPREAPLFTLNSFYERIQKEKRNQIEQKLDQNVHPHRDRKENL